MNPTRDHDPYSLLGVTRGASQVEVARAFRRAARDTHPDRRPGDPDASERFTAVAAAYQTLSDPDRRRAYDLAHPAPAAPSTRRSHAASVPLDVPLRRSVPSLDLSSLQLGTRRSRAVAIDGAAGDGATEAGRPEGRAGGDPFAPFLLLLSRLFEDGW
jgi:curved DNA-binding protein CbpA